MLRKNLSALSLSLLVLLTVVVPASALDLGGHVRDGVVVGVNFGGGWNNLEATIPGDDGPQTGKTGSLWDFTGGVNVGWARSDYFIASLGVYGWKERFYYWGDSLTVTTFHFLAELAWFPRGEGFWVKGGLGLGNLDFYLNKIPVKINFQSGGVNYTLGTGYEFRVADNTAFGFAYDYRYLAVGEFEGLDDTKVHSHNYCVSLRFYMD